MTDELNRKTVTRADWIAALRSGEYEQGVGSLLAIWQGQPCYCSLGVLCAIAGVPQASESGGFNFGDQTTKNYLEDVLAPMVGMNEADLGTCVWLNDTCGASFATIAEVLEDHPEPDGVRKEVRVYNDAGNYVPEYRNPNWRWL